MDDNSITIKLILLGDSSVGKTSILNSYISEDCNSNPKPTVGVDYRQKQFTFNNQQINLFIFDTAGQERYRSVSGNYLRNVHGAILVFDLTKRNTFDLLNNWLETIKNKVNIQDMFICFVGNKSDRKEEIVVSDAEINQKIKEIYGDAKFFKTSAISGNGINEMFDELITMALKKQNLEYGGNHVELTSTNKRFNKCC